MNVTLSLPKELYVAMKEALDASIVEQEAFLDTLKRNRDELAKAIDPIKRIPVQSERDPMRTYIVTKDDSGAWAKFDCSCPSFQYGRGLDGFGFCKHIRKALDGGM